MKKRIVVLSGAGISAESGIKTFRDADGLWEGQDVMQVASPQGWAQNKELVLQFYNERRAQANTVEPNAAHYALAELEEHFEVKIITQNVDNLHERAGSTDILHLHGELFKMRSDRGGDSVKEIQGDIQLGDKAPDGGQYRPHIVWFGESVPMFEPAARLAATADIMIVVGTSLLVYPANTLVDYASPEARLMLVDPNKPEYTFSKKVEFFIENATTGLPKVAKLLKDEFVSSA